MRNQLIISLEALANNYRQLRSLAKNDCGAVVKANGYGLGASPIAQKLLEEGCENFFVATFEEGIELRKTIQNANIFIFHGPMNAQSKDFQAHNLIPVLNNIAQLKLWPKDAPAAAHFDTGMTRLGFDENAINELADYNIVLIMSHLVDAENVDSPITNKQLTKFRTISEYFPKLPKSLANSSGVFLSQPYHFDICRPGIALYGGNPTRGKNPMQQVVKLIAPILQINEITTAKTIGYNGTYTAQKGDVIATVPAGYADGILRTLSNRGSCYFGNIKLPIVGRVSMDLITIKINDLPPEQRRIGQMVEILGESYNICDMARDAGTIEYEIITRLGNRFERVYK